MAYGITGLPRSRTAWFAMYFTAIGSPCVHEPYARARSDEDAQRVPAEYEGISDSSLILLNPPGITAKVIIHRSAHDVAESLEQAYKMPYRKTMPLLREWEKRLRTIQGLHIPYEKIDERLEDIHKWCVPYIPWDQEKADYLCNMSVTVNKLRWTYWYEEQLRGLGG